jgi:hypothetical protein
MIRAFTIANMKKVQQISATLSVGLPIASCSSGLIDCQFLPNYTIDPIFYFQKNDCFL